MWWLDAQHAQINISLAAMMDLIVDGVEQQVVDAAGVLSEGGHCLAKTPGRYLRPHHVDLLRTLVPKPKNLLLRACVAGDQLFPTSSDDSSDHRLRYLDDLQRHCSHGPYPTH